MTYFGFLAQFLGIPIVALALLAAWDRRRRPLPKELDSYSPWAMIALHVVLAVVYTTPWDNYLVATQVWWYDRSLVTGVTFGWVPLEEYTFFVVQPIFTGLLWLALARRMPQPADRMVGGGLRAAGAATALGISAVSAAVLLAGWRPGTYAALELSWAMIPVAIQLGFGADILWRRRALVLATLGISTAYLALADAIAIESGTWTIDPEQSLGWLIGGVLPVEELIFFGLTNSLVTFGMTLAMALESRERLPKRIGPEPEQTAGQRKTAPQP